MMRFLFSLGLCLGLLGIYEVTGQLTQQVHLDKNLTQNATGLCTRNGTRYCLMVDLYQNDDTIGIVFFINQTSRMNNSVGTFDSLGNGITVDMSSGSTKYWFAIYWDWPPTVFDQSAIDAFAYEVGSDTVSVSFLSKSIWVAPYWDWVTFAGDVIFTASCNVSELQDTVITSAGLSVIGDIDEAVEVFTLESTLTIYLANGLSPGAFIQLGELIYLQVEIVSTTGGSNAATGVYVWDLWVCDLADCSGMKKPLLDNGGCTIAAPVLANGFTTINGVARTADFEVFQLNTGAPPPITIYFHATVGYCFDAADQRCVDYCSNPTPAGKRKKRQAQEDFDPEETQTIVTHITIGRGWSAYPRSDGDNGQELPSIVIDPTPDPVEETKTMGLIAAVVVLAGLLFVGLVVAVAVFVRLSRRVRVSEKTMQ